MNLKNGKFSKEGIVYFSKFPIYNKFKRTGGSGILILTKFFLLFCKNSKKLLFKTKTSNIEKIIVQEGGEDEKLGDKIYHIYVLTENNRNYVFETIRHSQAEETYQEINREVFDL